MASKEDSEVPHEPWWKKKNLPAFSDEAAKIQEFKVGEPSTEKLHDGSNFRIVTWAGLKDEGLGTYNSGR